MATNRELAEQAYAAINSRDLDAFVELVHPDVEFVSLIAEAEGRLYRGHDGVREWWRSVADALGGLDFRMEAYQDLGDYGIARIRVTGTVAGVAVPQTMWQAFAARGDRPIWWQTFRTEEEAIEAVEARR